MECEIFSAPPSPVEINNLPATKTLAPPPPGYRMVAPLNSFSFSSHSRRSHHSNRAPFQCHQITERPSVDCGYTQQMQNFEKRGWENGWPSFKKYKFRCQNVMLFSLHNYQSKQGVHFDCQILMLIAI